MNSKKNGKNILMLLKSSPKQSSASHAHESMTFCYAICVDSEMNSTNSGKMFLLLFKSSAEQSSASHRVRMCHDDVILL